MEIQFIIGLIIGGVLAFFLLWLVIWLTRSREKVTKDEPDDNEGG